MSEPDTLLLPPGATMPNSSVFRALFQNVSSTSFTYTPLPITQFHGANAFTYEIFG